MPQDRTPIPPITPQDLARAAGAAGRLLARLVGGKGGAK